jgi:hypothetical protein
MSIADPSKLGKHIAALTTAPSPLVGESITNGRPRARRVSGRGPDNSMQRPLTRLCFAKPPSPTRGEEKRPAIPRRKIP